MPIFLILRSKIKKMGIHSLFSFAAAGGESLLRQPLSGSRAAPAEPAAWTFNTTPERGEGFCKKSLGRSATL
jgi:hypothetical protein